MELGDLGTLREQIKATTSRRNSKDDHHVNVAISKAIRRYYRRKFRFNTVVIQMALNGERTEMAGGDYLATCIEEPPDPEVCTYYYPWDLLRFIRMSRLEWTPTRHLREYSLTDLTGRFSENLTGIPYGIAFDGTVIVVRPIVEPAYPVELNYMKDTGRPISKWVDGNWLMLDSVTGEKMADDTTSPWFDQAQDLIHWAACYELYMGVYGDLEKAQAAKQMERESLKELERGDQMTSEPRSAKAHYV